jgi:hypothetical protein
MIHDRYSLPVDTALAAVSLDKLFELVFNFSFLIVGTCLLYFRGVYLDFKFSGSSYILIFLFLLPMGYFFTLWARWNPLSRLVTQRYWRVSKIGILARIEDLVICSERSISKFMRDKPGLILFLGLYSSVLWLLFIAEYWLSLVILWANMDLGATVIALTTARLAFLMPFPGAAGALEASQVWIMGTLGFNPALGISLVLLIRARDVAIGLTGISLGSLSIKRQDRIGSITQSLKITGSHDYTEI